MSPFSLIEITEMHRRAGITRHSHFRFNPLRLLSALQKLLAARRPVCNSL